MKRGIFILAAVLITASVSGQARQEVIASAGGFNKSADNTMSISWTLGETIVPTFTSQDGSLILTHGFQQKLIVTAVEENLEEKVEVAIYPNPTREMINIRFSEPADKEVLLFLLDEQGRMVLTDRIEPAVLDKTINLQNFASGIYYLRMIKGKFVNVYKVVKL
jgi:hypothetical protein